ncbi:MAG: hypothetical protein Q8J92_11575 [Parvibaculum sp.]|nr:hypothetical protein [Parvibaculum sp.]
MLKVLGALNILLAALMLFGVMAAVVDLPGAIEVYEREREDVYALLSLVVLLSIFIAAALSNGIFAWRAEGRPVPRSVHLFNGLFLVVQLAAAALLVWDWSRYTVGATFRQHEVMIILLPLLVVGPTYVFLLARRTRTDPTP